MVANGSFFLSGSRSPTVFYIVSLCSRACCSDYPLQLARLISHHGEQKAPSFFFHKEKVRMTRRLALQ